MRRRPVSATKTARERHIRDSKEHKGGFPSPDKYDYSMNPTSEKRKAGRGKRK